MREKQDKKATRIHMSTRIIDFWKANTDFWFPITRAEKEKADTLITEQFLSYDYTSETLYGQIIYLDQFTRHFQRKLGKGDVEEARAKAASLVHANLDSLVGADQVELVFALMPLKHRQEYECLFTFIHTRWLKDRKLTDYPVLNKFYMDTYKKAYTHDTIQLRTEHSVTPYYPSDICDSYPERYNTDDWLPMLLASSTKEINDLLQHLDFRKPVLVSLSGGVDSMVLLALLARLGVPTIAVHIVYGNREESQQEYAFLVKYCLKLNIPLYTFAIPWLRRSQVDRAFYESMTRDLRFASYKGIRETTEMDLTVLLGHIQEDVVENIWTNFATGQHLGCLKKMAREETQMGITLCRPFLTVEKTTIYKVSEQLAIPYLKNTTPSWSNRGKFREHFLAATRDQFGPNVDAKIIQVATAFEKQTQMIDRLLYRPILDSYTVSPLTKEISFDITLAIQADMDETGWIYIFDEICHERLGKKKPSRHAIRQFMDRLARSKGLYMPLSLRITMKKDLIVIVRNTELPEKKWFLHII